MKKTSNWMFILAMTFFIIFFGMQNTDAMASENLFTEAGEKKADAVLLESNKIYEYIPRPAGDNFDQGIGGWFKIMPTATGICVLNTHEGRSIGLGYWIYAYDANGDLMWKQYIEEPETINIDVTAGEALYLRTVQGWICNDRHALISVCFPNTHEWQSLAKPIVTEASCISTGSYCDRECILCGYRDVQETPLTEHTPGPWYVEIPPTCISEGEEMCRCSVCGTLLDRRMMPVLGHEPDEGVIFEEPTYTTPGYRQVFCINCGEPMYTEEIPPLPITVIASEELETSDGYIYWEVNDAGILTINGTGSIPDYSTLGLTDNLAPWFEEFCYDVSEIVIGEGITRIGNSAFQNMLNLESVSIPNSVVSIGDFSFSGCMLTQIIIPDGVNQIGKNPFIGCDFLSEIEVSIDHPYFASIDGVLFSKTEKRLITYPSGFEGVVYAIPDGVEIIGDYAFSANGTIEEVKIPESVREMGDNPFMGCYSLDLITVSPDNSNFSVIDNVLFQKKDKRLICYPLGNMQYSYEVPEGILSIGSFAFWGCEQLETIVLPDTVVSIGEGAFLGFYTIPASITIPASVKEIGDMIVDEYSNVTLVVERNSVAKEYASANQIEYTYVDVNDWLEN